MRSILLAAAFLSVLVLVSGAHAAILYGPSPYLSAGDSPFASLSFSSFYLEDFEDGSLNTLGASASSGFALPPGVQTDSVDADDGVIDGFGTAGRSWYVGTSNFVEFSFDPVALGGYPTHAGIVWTDVGFTSSGIGSDAVSFEAFAPGGASLGVIGPTAVGEGLTTGETGEDRFFGVSDPGGIARIRLTMATSQDWEVDHLQYGIIPEPATGLLAVLGLLLPRFARRR